MSTTYAGRFDVLRQFLKDASPDCRVVAVADFARLHGHNAPQTAGPSVVESLKAVAPLLDDNAERVRLTVLRSIGKLVTRVPKVDAAMTDRIRRAANSDPSLKVRQRARGVMCLLPE